MAFEPQPDTRDPNDPVWQDWNATRNDRGARPVPRLAPLAAGPAPQPNAAPPAAPQLPVVGQPIPQLQMPTKKESQAAGKEEYARGLPSVTAAPYTPEWAQQQEQQAQYKRLHPLGSDISSMPGAGGKFLHGLSRVANIAGDILAPGIALNVPGSDMNKMLQEHRFQNEFTSARENELKNAEANRQNTESKLIPWTSPEGVESQVMQSQWAPLEEGKEREAAEGKRTAATSAAEMDREKSREAAEAERTGETEAGANKRTAEDVAGRASTTAAEIAERGKDVGREISSREKIAGEEIAGREKVALEGKKAEQRDKDLAAVAKDKETKWIQIQQKYAAIANSNMLWNNGKLKPEQQDQMNQELQQLQDGYEEQLQRYGQDVKHYDVAGRKTVKIQAPNGQQKDVPEEEVEHYKSLGATVVPKK